MSFAGWVISCGKSHDRAAPAIPQAAIVLAVAGGSVRCAHSCHRSAFRSGQLFDFRSTENTVEILEAGIARDPHGGLILKDTDATRALRKDVPDLWYIIRDGQGHQLTEGDIPEEYAGIGNALDRIGQARFGWNIGDRERPTARMRWVETDAGRVQILTGSSALAPFFMVFLGISLILLKLVVPILGIIALGAFVATPIVVRRSLRGLEQAAAQADSIDIEKRGVRLTSTGMPSEVTPFVRAVNGALGRLDEGYDRQERFSRRCRPRTAHAHSDPQDEGRIVATRHDQISFDRGHRKTGGSGGTNA